MNCPAATKEERQLRPQLIQFARIACDNEPGTRIRLDGFGQREAARGTIELVPALVRLCGWIRWVEQGWHCEGAAAYPSPPAVQIALSGTPEWILVRRVTRADSGCGIARAVGAG